MGRCDSIVASCGLPELTQNVTRSSHGHSTPSLKISCKSVQPFSRNLADKETKKQRKSLNYNTLSPYREGEGNNKSSVNEYVLATNYRLRHTRLYWRTEVMHGTPAKNVSIRQKGPRPKMRCRGLLGRDQDLRCTGLRPRH